MPQASAQQSCTRLPHLATISSPSAGSSADRLLLSALLLTFQSVAGVSFPSQTLEGGTAMESLLTIGQFARVTSVPAKTIRNYEQVGVLPVPRRSANGYRQ